MEHVLFVQDGDTFCTNSGEYVRLADIDTPEEGEPGYQEAKNRLIGLIFDRDVSVYRQATDAYGRTVAYVSRDGFDISTLMKPLST